MIIFGSERCSIASFLETILSFFKNFSLVKRRLWCSSSSGLAHSLSALPLNSHNISFIGADVNKVDKFGRSPLHVASAVDYVAMVEFLLENGACVDAETFGEKQTALHFAAKNDAVNAMKMLLAYKSDINCTDYKDRTPLQVILYQKLY